MAASDCWSSRAVERIFGSFDKEQEVIPDEAAAVLRE
jgi:hypothetical protein